jgi:chemotaxis signal transduction protein
MSAAATSDRGAYVLLHVGNRRFALPSGNVVELAPPVRLHEFPHESKFVAGVIVRRGRIVPVYDVAPLLTGRASSLHRFYLITWLGLTNGREASAIPVTGECELTSAEVLPRSSDDPDYFAGKLAIEDGPIDILNFESVVAAGSSGALAREVRP